MDRKKIGLHNSNKTIAFTKKWYMTDNIISLT